MSNAALRPIRVFPAVVLIGALTGVTFLSCSRLPTENTPGSPTLGATSTLTDTPVPSWSVSTPTVTPPIIAFPGLSPGETPVIVKGTINAPGPTLKVYSGPGSDLPVLAELLHKQVVDVMGKSQGGWLYVSDTYPGSALRGWVDAKYILMEEADRNKIGFVLIVTPTALPFLP